MYRGRLWTMRMFAGFGAAEDTNERFKYLLEERLFLLVGGEMHGSPAGTKPLLSSKPRPGILAARSGLSSRNARPSRHTDIQPRRFHMHRIIKAALAALACAFIAAPVAAQTIDKIKQTGAITIGHRDASIPFSYYDDKQQVVGYAMDDNYKTPLIVEAVRMAARNVTFAHDAIFHSDRGSNYTSASFAAALVEHGVRQSVGRTGICYDNAMAESFFGTLKNERVHRTVYPTRERARADIAQYIELRYNTRRIHSGLGYRTPQEVHDAWLNSQEVA